MALDQNDVLSSLQGRVIYLPTIWLLLLLANKTSTPSLWHSLLVKARGHSEPRAGKAHYR